MQRTVKGTRVNLAKMGFEDGRIVVIDTDSVVYPNTPVDKAIKKAQKAYAGYGVVSTEDHEQTYYLDDEIFFRFATTTPLKSAKTENDGQ